MTMGNIWDKINYQNSYEGRKQLTYQSISNETESLIFNLLTMNENKMKEIHDIVDWSKVIVTGISQTSKACIIFLKLITGIVHEYDVKFLEQKLNEYLLGIISDTDVSNFLVKYLSSIGVSMEFYSNALMYIWLVINNY